MNMIGSKKYMRPGQVYRYLNANVYVNITYAYLKGLHNGKFV